jgi:hypothetical protein
MKTQTKPFVVVTKRRRAAQSDAETLAFRQSVFRTPETKPLTKEDVRAGLNRR